MAPFPPFLYRIRMSGIKGLQGVVRKTVNDELQANIWDPQHMDKIVPSLLFNLQHVEEAERYAGEGGVWTVDTCDPPGPPSPAVWEPHGAGWLAKPDSGASDLGFCGLFCRESGAGSLGASGLAFRWPAVLGEDLQYPWVRVRW